MTAEAKVLPPLRDDLRRMAPVWALVMGTAVVVVFGMKYISLHFLENALTANRSGCDFANLYIAAGRKKMTNLRVSEATLRSQQPDLTQSALGIMKGDPELERAREDFRHALELCAVSIEAHHYLATLDWYAGDSASAYYHVGALQMRQKKAADAIPSLRMALEENPEHLGARVALALSYRETGRLDEGLELVQGFEDRIISTAEGMIALGMLYARGGGDAAEAERLLRDGLSENPTDIPAILELRSLFERRKAFREGGSFFYALGSQGKPTVGDSAHAAAVLFAQAGDLEMEEKAYRRMLEFMPNHIRVMFQLALNLHKQDKTDAARDMLTQAMERDPKLVMGLIQEYGVTPGTK